MTHISDSFHDILRHTLGSPGYKTVPIGIRHYASAPAVFLLAELRRDFGCVAAELSANCP